MIQADSETNIKKNLNIGKAYWKCAHGWSLSLISKLSGIAPQAPARPPSPQGQYVKSIIAGHQGLDTYTNLVD